MEAAELLGRRDSFAEFYRRAYPGAKRLAYLLLNGSPDAEDVVQEAFTRLHRHHATIEHPDRYLRVSGRLCQRVSPIWSRTLTQNCRGAATSVVGRTHSLPAEDIVQRVVEHRPNQLTDVSGCL